ncbi:tetratricopeptide repeat protein [Roseimaritima ulvae]|uniref:Tetratricopeptide repeat protein n=1 Tax=Roseimaritima ulvae TaxID=980254 RepID=A0A5B9QXG7_9BACT|nr:hypothetical protein [Roseimaritima ulvae]QEG42702.1 hypothetical protein UC8_47440 [Roseimaritima ulvae]
MGTHAGFKLKQTLWLTLLMLLSSLTGWAQSDSGALQDAEQALHADHLGAGSYAQRQQATRWMWSERTATREEVERAARDPDPEIASRARWILQRWQQGLLPDTPPDVLRRLAGSEGIDRLEGLLDAGLFRSVIVAVEQAAGTAQGPQLRSEVSDSLRRRFAFYVRTAEESNQLDAFCDLLDAATESPALAVARAELLTRLGFDLRQRGELPASARRWSELQRTRTTVLIRATLGDVDEALQAAQAANQQDMVRACHLLLGNWQELIGESQREAESAAAGSLEAYRNWSDLLIAAHRANRQPLAELAVQQLADEDQLGNDPLAIELRWRCLLIHGYVDEALQLLRPSNPVDAAEVLSYLGRFDEAFEVLGIDADDPEPGSRALLRQARQEVADTTDRQRPSAVGTPSLERLLMAGKLWLRVGEHIRGHQVFEEVASWNFAEDRNERARHQAVVALWQMGHSERAIELAAADHTSTIAPVILYDMIRWIAGRDEQQAKALAAVWEGLLQIDPERPASERLQLVARLQRGEIPWENDADSHFQKLFDRLHGGKPTVHRVNGRLVVTGRGYANTALGDFFSRLGQTDYARRIYLLRSAAGDSTADLQLAKLELATGSASEALKIYQRIWARHSGLSAQPHEVNTADADLVAALKAVIGEVIAIERSGDDIEAEKRRRLLQLMLSGSSASARKDFCDYLVDIGEQELAKETLEHLLRYTAFGADETLDFGRIALGYGSLLEEEQPQEAARWRDLALSGTLETMAYYARGYLILPAQHQALRALAAAKRQERSSVAEHLNRSLRLYPMNINMAEDLLGKLRELGMVDEADQALAKIFEVGRRHLEQFPNDAEDANNLAWVAALSNQRLDEALELSRRACFLHPDSASYRDTMAEVLYRQGRVEEALVLERHCLLDEPGLWHLHEQIARFEAGE